MKNHAASNVIQLSKYRTPAPKRVRVKSQYARYPLPFFNRKKRCAWDVHPTGDFCTDYKTGEDFAAEFLSSYDGTWGWASLLPSVVADMILAGTHGTHADGQPKINTVVLGFTVALGHELARACAMGVRA